MKRWVGVLIDTRERDIWDAMTEHENHKPASVLRGVGPPHPPAKEMMPILEKRMLPIGDVWLVLREETPSDEDDNSDDAHVKETILMIWERKTVSDLWSSIQDGRHHEQHDRVIRFAKELSNDFTYLRVIEGPCPSQSVRLTTIPYETFFHVCLRTYEAPPTTQTIRTCSMNETIMLLHTAWKKTTKTHCMSTDAPPPICKPGKQARLWKSLAHCKKIGSNRKDQVTKEFVLACSLAVVPQVSFTIAENIATQFKDMESFISEYHANQSEWSEKMKNGMTRSSPKLVQRIISFFFTQP